MDIILSCLKKPIRSCIVCRDKINQEELIRLQCNKDKKLVPFSNNGRSFYICKECFNGILENKNLKKAEKAFFIVCKNKDNYIEQLKEILADVR